MNQEPELKAIYATPGIFTGAPKLHSVGGTVKKKLMIRRGLIHQSFFRTLMSVLILLHIFIQQELCFLF
jgi:hypothetical protein